MCENTINKKFYKREKTFENKIMTYMNEEKKRIQRTLFFGQPWTMNEFCQKTTIEIMNQTSIYSFKLNTGFKQINEEVVVPLSSNARIFNILTFDKSWDYLLKYIAYHIPFDPLVNLYQRNLDKNQRNHVFVFCDQSNFFFKLDYGKTERFHRYLQCSFNDPNHSY
jgi:hypothetical protein